MSLRFLLEHGDVGELPASDERRRMTVDCSGDGVMTKQAFKAECDINTIMEKYARDGLLDHVSKYEGQYADVSAEVDYQMALETIFRAEEAFMSLPAKIRTKFDNDPQRFLEFVEDPSNHEEMIELGLRKKGEVSPMKGEPDVSIAQPESKEPAEPAPAEGAE